MTISTQDLMKQYNIIYYKIYNFIPYIILYYLTFY